MKKTLIATAALMLMAGSAQARDAALVVGSSTVYPFTTAVAENFGKNTGMNTPVIESTGTGGGLKLFCAGIGNDTPDAVNASRPIKEGEIETCAKNGVVDPIELTIGKDALVLAHVKGNDRMSITLEQIYLALAKQIPVDGKLVANPYRKWSDIDSSLPDVKIEVLGPPPTSGTRDSFVEMAMHKGCKTALEKANLKLDKDAEKSACETIREDGGYVEAGENDNLIVQKLKANPNAFGIFGFSFLDANSSELEGVIVEGTEPTFESAADGSYILSRNLYVYFKREHMDVIPGLKEFAQQLVSENAIGDEGYLTDKGLVPLPEVDREAQRAKLQ